MGDDRTYREIWLTEIRQPEYCKGHSKNTVSIKLRCNNLQGTNEGEITHGYGMLFKSLRDFRYQTASPKIFKTSATDIGLWSIYQIPVLWIQWPACRTCSCDPRSFTGTYFKTQHSWRQFAVS